MLHRKAQNIADMIDQQICKARADFEGKLFLRRLPEQPVALMVAEVPAFYDELEALAIVRAVAEAGGLPEGRRIAWNEALGAGLSVGVLAFESSGPSRATGRRFLKRAGTRV